MTATAEELDEPSALCPACGCKITKSDAHETRYCPSCGARLPEMTEQAIFDVARDLDSDRRRDFLDSVCENDPTLRKRMDALLAAEFSPDSLLDLPVTDLPDTDSVSQGPPANSLPADLRIGPYKLLQRIGEGGMGSVYMAEQLQPVRRVVALKIVKAGLDSKQVVARFEAERQTLALMDHPNIAKVLDAGETERGEPYFVMELVKGVPLTEYCDTNRITTRQRIQLVTDVCNAVQHAHQKGIIHRDLKPSNILVAQYDDRPVPKVIDFGVAKATHQKLTEKTLYTQLGQIVGTLEYMSPEQAVLNQLDVDTRTDVYSLGVILYELLVGETPLASKELRSQGLEQILRTIREQEPARPSVRLSSQGQAATQTAAYRRTDTQALSRVLRGDLDWIVMKALEKDRARRYDSASRLAEDLKHYLAGETVEARPPTAGYRLKKAWQRNRVLLSSAAAIILALSIGLVGVWLEKGKTEKALKDVTEQRESKQRLLQENQRQSELLAAQLVRSENVLAHWRQSVIRRGIEIALHGDVNRTDELVAEARESDAPEEWILAIQGLAKMNSGATDEAEALLLDAHEMAPNNLSVACMLVMSMVGNEGSFVQREERTRRGVNFDLFAKLGQIPPSTEYAEFDHLFRGWSQLYEDPTEAIQTLRPLVDVARPWALSQAMCAMALVHEAADTADPHIAVEALDAIRDCEDELQNNPFVMFIALDCRCVALLFAGNLTDEEHRQIFIEAESIADQLEQYPYGWAVDFRAGFYELVGHEKTVDVYSRTRNDWWCANRAAVMLRLRPTWVQTELRPNALGSPFQSIGDATALALSDRVAEARANFDQLQEIPVWPIRITSLEILLSTGDQNAWDECTSLSRKLLAEVENLPVFFDTPFWVMKPRLQYLAEDYSTDEEFVRAMKGSRYGECYAYYLIGLKHRCQGFEDASHFFRKCVETKQFWMPQYQFSKTLLAIEYGISLPPEIQLNLPPDSEL